MGQRSHDELGERFLEKQEGTSGDRNVVHKESRSESLRSTRVSGEEKSRKSLLVEANF
jgi:hypothetical protein